MPTERIAVGVVESSPLYRTAVVRLFTEAPDIEVDAVADSVARFAACRRRPGSVVVMDLSLPGVRDSAAVLALSGMGHRVLVLSARTGRAEVRGALAAGARGYLSKRADGAEVLRAVHEIAAGNRYLASSLATALLGEPGGWGAAPLIELSEREREVLARLALGERDQDIAHALEISVRTVRSYLDRVRDKTGLRRRPELTRYAIEHGVIADERACGGDRVSA